MLLALSGSTVRAGLHWTREKALRSRLPSQVGGRLAAAALCRLAVPRPLERPVHSREEPQPVGERSSDGARVEKSTRPVRGSSVGGDGYCSG